MSNLSTYFLSNAFMLPFATGIVLFSLLRFATFVLFDDVLFKYITVNIARANPSRDGWADYIVPIFFGIGLEFVVFGIGISLLHDYAGWAFAYLVMTCTLPPANRDIFGDRMDRYTRRHLVQLGLY